MFVITGATGHVGAVAAEALLAEGKAVRVVVRDAAKAEGLRARGAEVFVADLGDQAALGRAVRGAGSLAAEKVPHVVLLSSVGAQHPSGTGLIVSAYNVEQQLRASGLAATFVRASYFVENWGAVVHPVRSDGVLPSFLAAD